MSFFFYFLFLKAFFKTTCKTPLFLEISKKKKNLFSFGNVFENVLHNVKVFKMVPNFQKNFSQHYTKNYQNQLALEANSQKKLFSFKKFIKTKNCFQN